MCHKEGITTLTAFLPALFSLLTSLFLSLILFLFLLLSLFYASPSLAHPSLQFEHVLEPKVNLNQVVLPPGHLNSLLSQCSAYDAFRKYRVQKGLVRTRSALWCLLYDTLTNSLALSLSLCSLALSLCTFLSLSLTLYLYLSLYPLSFSISFSHPLFHTHSLPPSLPLYLPLTFSTFFLLFWRYCYFVFFFFWRPLLLKFSLYLGGNLSIW